MMQSRPTIYIAINYLLAVVWLVNGLLCKLLNVVPRHQLIVAKILGDNYAWIFTNVIGVAEIIMAIWIASFIQSHLFAVVQIIIILLMNVLEFFLAPELLLFGKINLLFAFVLAFVIYFNEFVFLKRRKK